MAARNRSLSLCKTSDAVSALIITSIQPKSPTGIDGLAEESIILPLERRHPIVVDVELELSQGTPFELSKACLHECCDGTHDHFPVTQTTPTFHLSSFIGVVDALPTRFPLSIA